MWVSSSKTNKILADYIKNPGTFDTDIPYEAYD